MLGMGLYEKLLYLASHSKLLLLQAEVLYVEHAIAGMQASEMASTNLHTCTYQIQISSLSALCEHRFRRVITEVT